MSEGTIAATDGTPELNSELRQASSHYSGVQLLLMAWIPFIIASASTAALLHAMRPGPTSSYVSIYTEKCIAASRSADPPNVIVVGTSRMFNGIDPRIVEDELKQLGRPLCVWNLSLHSLSLAEQTQVLTDIFSHLNLRPQLILYEPPLRLGMTLQNATVARSVYFTGWRGFRDSWEFILAADRDFARKYFNLASCGVYFGVALTNYGLFSDLLFPDRYVATTNHDPKTRYMLASKGFWPSGMEADGIIKAHPSSNLEDLGIMAEDMEKRETSRTDLLPAKQMTQIRRVDELIKSYGAASLAVLMPKYFIPEPYYQRADFQLSRSLASARSIDSIDFQCRLGHPDLYRAEMWYDYNHLSEAGSVIFSRRIAAEICDRLGGSK